MNKILNSFGFVFSKKQNNIFVFDNFFYSKYFQFSNSNKLFSNFSKFNSRTIYYSNFINQKSKLLSTSKLVSLQKFYSSMQCDKNSCSFGFDAKNMPTIQDSFRKKIDDLIRSNSVLIFSKTQCPYCVKVKALFDKLGVKYNSIEIDLIEDGKNLALALKDRVNKTSVPQVFINGTHLGGCDDVHAAHDSGKLKNHLESLKYDYDLIVIGGGSGGLAASKEASKLGKRVALFDFVTESPRKTVWGIGGTCVNVGCIPKKLMHQAALIGEAIKQSNYYGWENKNGDDLKDLIQHNWPKMVESVQANIKSTNFKYRVALRNEKVNYMNAYVSFEDSHKVKVVDKSNKVSFYTSKDFIIATGERPKYPNDCEGALEYGITSDDLFSLPNSPGKTIVVGASYVALECAGFLKGLGLDVTVLVRSILLRGFDQEMAEKIGEHMSEIGIKFLRPCIPKKIELVSELPRILRVTCETAEGKIITEECETVLFAIGRKPCTNNIGLEKVGVNVEKNGKISVINEQTNVPNIYAIGDILKDKPELTPVAIEAGLLLANRLYNYSNKQCDYSNIPTTIFSPLEYGCVGLSEEDAIRIYGENNIEVYIQNSTPFEWGISHHLDNKCYSKLICLLKENQRVLGFHFLGPNAGEITQLAAIALKKNSTKFDFDSIIGIHPTCAEIFTNLKITRRSGVSPMQALCCG